MNNSNHNDNEFLAFCNSWSNDYLNEILPDMEGNKKNIIISVLNKRKEVEAICKLEMLEQNLVMAHNEWKKSIKDCDEAIKNWRLFVSSKRKVLDDAKEELHQLKRNK